MSFANFDLEAQGSLKNKAVEEPAPQNELDNIISKTAKQLERFGELVAQLDLQKRHVGTRRDCLQLRRNIDELVSKITEMEKAVESLVLNISQLINKKLNEPKVTDSNSDAPKLNISNKQVVIKERLVNEFYDLHKQFQKSIRIYNEKKVNYSVKERTNSVQQIDENTPLILQDPQLVQEQVFEEETIGETELQYHLLLTEERNREIDQVTHSITEVNSIFKDLGQLVLQQGEQLDTVEENILQLHGNTHQAERELTKAHEYQKKKGKWTCILLVALCVFVLIMVLAVVS